MAVLWSAGSDREALAEPRSRWPGNAILPYPRHFSRGRRPFVDQGLDDDALALAPHPDLLALGQLAGPQQADGGAGTVVEDDGLDGAGALSHAPRCHETDRAPSREGSSCGRHDKRGCSEGL